MIRFTSIALTLVPLVMFQQGGGLPLPGTPATDQPGRPTQARVYILNKDPRTEAIPTTWVQGAEALRVTVSGTPTVGVSGVVLADTRSRQQIWEYQQVLVANADDPSPMLNAAGLQGWELVVANPRGTGTAYLLKRPK